MTQALKWRRTALTQADGSPVPDDWTLVDARGQAVGRIYKMTGGPQDGHSFWTVLVDEQARPCNGGTGSCPTGPEAKAAVEARIPRTRLDELKAVAEGLDKAIQRAPQRKE